MTPVAFMLLRSENADAPSGKLESELLSSVTVDGGRGGGLRYSPLETE